jgi:hypothetical protein
MKPLNYLRVLVWFVASVLIAIWRFGLWCVGKAVRPGLTWEYVWLRYPFYRIPCPDCERMTGEAWNEGARTDERNHER